MCSLLLAESLGWPLHCYIFPSALNKNKHCNSWNAPLWSKSNPPYPNERDNPIALKASLDKGEKQLRCASHSCPALSYPSWRSYTHTLLGTKWTSLSPHTSHFRSHGCSLCGLYSICPPEPLPAITHPLFQEADLGKLQNPGTLAPPWLPVGWKQWEAL